MIQLLKVHPDLPASGGAQELADKKANILAEVYANSPGPPRLRNVSVAFRATRKKANLESVQKRLDSCQSLIPAQIIVLIPCMVLLAMLSAGCSKTHRLQSHIDHVEKKPVSISIDGLLQGLGCSTFLVRV